MNRSGDEKLREELAAVHEHERASAPDFDETWRAAQERQRSVGATAMGWKMLAVAASIAVVSLVVFVATQTDDSTDRPGADPDVTLSSGATGPAATDEATDLASYDILDWEPATDALLAQDDRVLEPPVFGEPGWGDTDFEEWNTESHEEL